MHTRKSWKDISIYNQRLLQPFIDEVSGNLKKQNLTNSVRGRRKKGKKKQTKIRLALKVVSECIVHTLGWNLFLAYPWPLSTHTLLDII